MSWKQERLKTKVRKTIDTIRAAKNSYHLKPLAENCIGMIGRIEDQVFLWDIAKNTHIIWKYGFEIRKAAIERIRDQKMLAEMTVSLDSTYNADDRRLSDIAQAKVINDQDIKEAWAARKAEQDRLIAVPNQMRANEEAKEKALLEERISKGLCPKCGSNKAPIYGLIGHLDMYGDYCPDCEYAVRLP